MSPDVEDLKKIKGIGASTEERIKDTLDIDSIEELAALSTEDLMKVDGIGNKTAENILENAKALIRECGRCESRLVGEKVCESCLEELEEQYEGLSDEIDYLDIPEEVQNQLGDTLSNIRSHIEKGEIEKGFETAEDLKDDVKDNIIFSDLVEQVDKKMDENSDVIDFSIYNKKVKTLTELWKKGKYERGIKRAKKILDYIDDEKNLGELDKSELKELDITEFCRKISGVKSLTGEKLYKQGYKSVKAVGSAGQIQIVEDTGIKGEEADVLIKRIRDFVGEIEFEVERREVEESPEEEEEEEEEERSKDVFLEIESPEQLRKERKEQEKRIRRDKRPEKEPKARPKVHVTSEKEITKEKRSVITVDEDEETADKGKLIYWIPALILPIIFIGLAIVLFFL